MVTIPYIKKLINEFEAAVRADEMKGAGHPEDRNYVILKYETAKSRLIQACKELQNGSNQ